MHTVPGTLQRTLHRMVCEWGTDRREYQAAYPVFNAAYKVSGILGLNVGEAPVWYPSVPVTVEPRLLRFKAPYADEIPGAVNELAEPVLAGQYLCDPWHAVLESLRRFETRPDWPEPVDLFERTCGGQPIVDVIFEHPLHRVRGFLFRRGWYWTRRVPIFAMPALEHALDPPEIPPPPVEAAVDSAGEVAPATSVGRMRKRRGFWRSRPADPA